MSPAPSTGTPAGSDSHASATDADPPTEIVRPDDATTPVEHDDTTFIKPAPASDAGPQGDPLAPAAEPAAAADDDALAPDDGGHAAQGDALLAPDPGADEQQAPDDATEEQPAELPAEVVVPAGSHKRPGFRERGRLRRRLRYLREVRELGFRDLGGLVFDQHRFQRPNATLVSGKVAAIDAVDIEVRAIDHALENRTPYTELFIPGVSACQRCGALHGSDARYCPNCGLAFAGPRALSGIGPEGSPYGPAQTPPGQAVLFDPQHPDAQAWDEQQVAGVPQGPQEQPEAEQGPEGVPAGPAEQQQL